jgi:Cft2 family RNA processing exonuclease
MKITFLGGADEVGASCTLIEIGGKRILVDAGIRPSPKARWGLAGDQLPNLSQIDSLGSLDAILITHAHTDHTGALELVTGRFPDTPVYATPPTIALTRVLHQDSRRIMQTRLDEEGELPLFDDVAVQHLMSAFVPVPFNDRLSLGEGLIVTFFPAGHIAGAAMLGLESSEGRLLVTGDLSVSPQRTVEGVRPPAFHPDVLIIESTYGGRLHANRAVQERKLVETVARVTAEGGKVLIPAFALGRAQEILLILGESQRRGILPVVPVWADGMVRAICQVYSAFADVLPLSLQERGAKFFEGAIQPVQNNEQRNALIWQPDPLIIVASSGMLAGGPSASYARALAGKPKNAILLTGYQDEESPGRRLQELAERGSGSIQIGKDKVDVQCHLETYSLSAHADEGQLISLIETIAPEHVVLVHGDEMARASLEKALGERSRVVHLPQAGQSLELKFETRLPMNSSGKNSASAGLRTRWAELERQRVAGMAAFANSVGKWLLLKGETPIPARCLALESDHLWVEIAPGLEQSIFPEDVLTILGETPPSEADLEPFQPHREAPAKMEPNQALAIANNHFPLEAQLRKSGYRLDQHVLTLTFDFPDTAQTRFADQIASLQTLTGWSVELTAEVNQSALNALIHQVLPESWRIVKGPAIYRQEKRIEVSIARPLEEADTRDICDRFLETSGFQLELIFAAQPARPAAVSAPSGARLEINAAYAALKAALEGSTLYRTSLKGDEIVLSFISPQVADRYRAQIEVLSQQVGWPLSISPQANQGAILEAARMLLQKTGWKVVKGPGIYPEKAEVVATLAELPEADALSQITDTFAERTGFRLVITGAAAAPKPPAGLPNQPVVEIPIQLIKLNRSQQTLSLDPLKLEKATERARRQGITPPIQVRRVKDGYILLDGLYRLRAAEALGLTRLPAVVE